MNRPANRLQITNTKLVCHIKNCLNRVITIVNTKQLAVEKQVRTERNGAEKGSEMAKLLLMSNNLVLWATLWLEP